ncbi:hypothetical protein EAD96_13750 [Micromonospora sp. BL1]|uniref:hypothetical protein n=1 Tax=Micromonospora sp. BL1 TaxID=2478709 RepID=UPI000EF5D518|nr:hypothetical protein [Micromonospora sp. BL1]RLQ04658.1 hypothetical protein EAD96_13750 [Micromonospora sp. BL1]
MFQMYPVLPPPNSNKDAKYSIVRGDSGDWEVRLIYRDSTGEHLRTNKRHKKLIAKVNEIKERLSSGRLGGVFYINEFRHVLVPSMGEGYIYAGTHRKLLDFDFYGRTLSPVAPSSLAPGDQWPGPHVGIRHVLASGGDDIYRVVGTMKHGSRKEFLSGAVGPEAARRLAHRLRRVKGYQGGRFYINEAREFFTPVGEDTRGVSYIYLGALGDEPWFAAPLKGDRR